MRRKYHHGDLKNALIQAGAELLADEGPAGLTLRRVAQRAGVSHSAPYAHFADKQALVAAISTDGLTRLVDRLEAAAATAPDAPLRRLVDAAWEAARFGIESPDQYRLTFSAAIEKEADHPSYQAAARRAFGALAALVAACQAAGALPEGPPERVALGLWSLVHGFVSLLTARQVPHRLVGRGGARALLLALLADHLRDPGLPARFPPPRKTRRLGG